MDNPFSATTELTTTAITTVSTKICVSNPKRKGFIIWNNSANSIYVGLSSSTTSSTCAQIIPTFTSWALLTPIMYTGDISAVRNAGSGTATVYELV